MIIFCLPGALQVPLLLYKLLEHHHDVYLVNLDAGSVDDVGVRAASFFKNYTIINHRAVVGRLAAARRTRRRFRTSMCLHIISHHRHVMLPHCPQAVHTVKPDVFLECGWYSRALSCFYSLRCRHDGRPAAPQHTSRSNSACCAFPRINDANVT